MRIRSIEVKNFRLLQDITLRLENGVTVIVGRNNSGKTSVTELFRRFLASDSPVFRLEDFSLKTHVEFWRAFRRKLEEAGDEAIRADLPRITARVLVDYEPQATALGPLGNFIIDLNSDCTSALIEAGFELGQGRMDSLFEEAIKQGCHEKDKPDQKFYRAIGSAIERHYAPILRAIDPNDSTNQKEVHWSQLRALLKGGLISAQRGLDDATRRESEALGKILQALFSIASSDLASPSESETVRKLEEAVRKVQDDIDSAFNQNLRGILPALTLFGYPGLSDPKLITETQLDVTRLLENHTRVRYSSMSGSHLPETYSGLGMRNLIFILLKLLEYFREFQADRPAANVQLVFVEEPEAHLHPQMQEVFISQLARVSTVFSQNYGVPEPWPVQFIVTTHSSHVANRAPLESIRYFFTTPTTGNDDASTRIRDLSQGLSGELIDSASFLRKFMILSRCDLFFADKAILVEGTAERLLLPAMIGKLCPPDAGSPPLSSQYVSLIEVGGAYAHRFLGLLEFLELKALVITDIDPARPAASGRLVRCCCFEGTTSTNGCIKAWFDGSDCAPEALQARTGAEKIQRRCRLAYQIPEESGGPCGRTFEDAFVLANAAIFALKGSTTEELEQEACEVALRESKTDFALKQALGSEDWIVPRYLFQGLAWLARDTPPDASSPSAAESAPSSVSTEQR